MVVNRYWPIVNEKYDNATVEFNILNDEMSIIMFSCQEGLLLMKRNSSHSLTNAVVKLCREQVRKNKLELKPRGTPEMAHCGVVV